MNQPQRRRDAEIKENKFFSSLLCVFAPLRLCVFSWIAFSSVLLFFPASEARAFPDCTPDVVAGFTPGPYAAFGHDLMPGVVLGFPGSSALNQQSLDVVSLGPGGAIILRFDDNLIVDRPGPDFIVFENPFFVTTVPGTCRDFYNVFAEPVFVSVSGDGLVWRALPYAGSTAVPAEGDSCYNLFPRDPISPTPREVIERCAGLGGLTPTYDSPRHRIRPDDPAAWDPEGTAGVSGWGGDAFDLAAVGLAQARYIRLESYQVSGSSNMTGADIDTVIAIHSAPAAGADPDSDGDGLSDPDETSRGLDPLDPDTDRDGMNDGYEAASCLCPLRHGDTLAGIDVDYMTGDGDGDGISDCYDNCPALANPGQADQDHDFLGDACEAAAGTLPADPDTDAGGMKDGIEVKAGRNPLLASDDNQSDQDNDGLSDYEETAIYLTGPASPDTDGDGLSDYDEAVMFSCYSPSDPDSDHDGLCDGAAAVFDGLTLICSPGEDLDGDGAVLCGIESDPCGPDSDGDGLGDGEEVLAYHTNPVLADSDADGCGDGEEIAAGSNPLDPDITPRVIKAAPDLRVTSQGTSSRDAAIAAGGAEFGLAWEDNRDGNYEIYFARVSGAGTKIGADLRVTANTSFSYDPALAYTGSEYGLAWEDNRDGNYEIYFARVSAAGVKIGGDLRVTSDASYSEDASLAWTGTEFGLAWRELRNANYEIYFTRVSASGAKIGGDLRLTNDPAASNTPVIAWTGSQYGLAWNDKRDLNDETYFLRLSPAGTVLGTELRVSNALDNSLLPALAFSGSEFGTAWHDRRDGNNEIYFARVTAAGALPGPETRLTTDAASSQAPAAVWAGNRFGLAWQEARDGNDEIYFAQLFPGGAKIGGDLRVTFADNYSKNPALAPAGPSIAAAWEDLRDGVNYEIYFTLFQPDQDGDGLADHDETATHHTDPGAWDSDHDGLCDADEIALATDPLDPDSDHDGLADGAEVNGYHTLPDQWDTDGDHLPDGFEAANLEGHTAGLELDPLDPGDGAMSFDGDGMPNAHEYWNGSGVWGDDPAPTPGYEIGCYYWGKADGGIAVQPGDIVAIQKAYVGVAVNYTEVLPQAYDPLDLDRDMFPGPGDIVLAQAMYAGLSRPSGYVSSPAALTVEDAPVGPVAVGDTTHVTLSVHAQALAAEPFSPGFGVVFWVTSGNAVLLGGEGTVASEAAGNRYDVSMKGSEGAPANVVVLVTGAGPISINAKVPACGTEPLGRWCGEVVLGEAVEINP